MSAFGYRKPADLPETMPLFPLTGAILFPRGALPLNVFEPRYLNMVDDALAGERLIGMIQPARGRSEAGHPALSKVGTAGRITTFSETEDGRYLITLTGVCRFRVDRELPGATPYRKAVARYDEFADDLKSEGFAIDRERLEQALRRYIDSRGYQADWAAVDEAPPEALVNAVATLCPFGASEKQALLEAPSLAARAAALVALLEYPGDDDDREQRLQ